MNKITIFNSDVCEYYKAIKGDDEYMQHIKEDIYDVEELTDELIWEQAYEDMMMAYEDECITLYKTLDEDVVVIADLGTWNGRIKGGKITGDNLNCILNYFGCDDVEVYADRYNIKSIGHHHDGSNKYLFRIIKDTLSDTQRENFIDKLERGILTDRDITRYTKSLRPYVAEVYGA